MLANGRFSSRPLTMAGVMCGSAEQILLGGVLVSTIVPLPTCAVENRADSATADGDRRDADGCNHSADSCEAPFS